MSTVSLIQILLYDFISFGLSFAFIITNLFFTMNNAKNYCTINGCEHYHVPSTFWKLYYFIGLFLSLLNVYVLSCLIVYIEIYDTKSMTTGIEVILFTTSYALCLNACMFIVHYSSNTAFKLENIKMKGKICVISLTILMTIILIFFGYFINYVCGLN